MGVTSCTALITELITGVVPICHVGLAVYVYMYTDVCDNHGHRLARM